MLKPIEENGPFLSVIQQDYGSEQVPKCFPVGNSLKTSSFSFKSKDVFNSLLEESLKKERRTQRLLKMRRLYEELIDGLYLAESMGPDGYQGNILGKLPALSHAMAIEAASITAIFALFCIVAACVKNEGQRSRLAKVKVQLRQWLSDAKNGRHAVINLVSIYGLIAHANVMTSFLSPAGGVAVAVGLLLVMNNLRKQRLENERRDNLIKLQKALGVLENDSVDFKSFSKLYAVNPPSVKRNRAIQFHSSIDAIVTNSLYVGGCVLLLASYFGLAAATGPAGIVLGTFYAFYTAANLLCSYVCEQEKQMEEEQQFLNFLEKLKSQRQLRPYLEKNAAFKDQVYKRLDKEANEPITAEELNKYINKRKRHHEAQVSVFKNQLCYKVAKVLNSSIQVIRRGVNAVKNSIAAVLGLGALIRHNSTQSVAGDAGIILIGLAVATPILFCQGIGALIKAIKIKEQPLPAASIKEKFDILHLFKGYQKSHMAFVSSLIKQNDYLNKPFSTLLKLKAYFEHPDNEVHCGGSFAMRYLSTLEGMKKCFPTKESALQYLREREMNESCEKEALNALYSGNSHSATPCLTLYAQGSKKRSEQLNFEKNAA